MNPDATGGVSADRIQTADKPATRAKVIRYRTPVSRRNRSITPLCRTDIMYAAVQVIGAGGENTLHSHTQLDGLWFVLRGRARFYGNENVLHGELGERDAILLPRGVSYRFESVGEEPLELLQVEAITKGASDEIKFHEPKKRGSEEFDIFSLEGEVLNKPATGQPTG